MKYGTKYGSHKELPTLSSAKYGSAKDVSSSSDSKTSPRFGPGSKPKKDDGPPITYNTRYGKTATNKDRSRDPSPAVDNKRGQTKTQITVSRVRSRDPSPVTQSKLDLLEARIRSRESSPAATSDNKLSVFSPSVRIKSREPSPIDMKRSSSSIASRIRSRDPSPAIETKLSTYSSSNRTRSRDPSPADYMRRSSREPSPADSARNGYSTPSYRLYSRSNTTSNTTPSYSSKYGSSTSIPRSSAVDKALSYLSASESRSRSASVNRATSISRDKEEKPVQIVVPKVIEKPVVAVDSSSDETEEEEEEDDEEEEESSGEPEPPPVMIDVAVCTRGTSPTQPSSSNFLRSRRADMAKTIEKTIKRPQKKPPMVDKEIQSDRMDDSTRYLRYTGSRTALQPWSSYLDSKYSSGSYSRYGSSSSSRYSRDSSSRSERDRSETEKKEDKSKSRENLATPTRTTTLSRSGSNKSLSSKSTTPTTTTTSSKSSDKSKTGTSDVKSKSPPSKSNSSSSKSKSPENTKSLPPMAPKAESPVKTTSASSNSNGCLKWTNKDFRKSALNMGTPDRPRKVRTNSSGTDTDTLESNPKPNTAVNSVGLRTERSPSVGSEISSSSRSSSTTSSLDDDSKLNKTKASSRTSLLASSADELPMDKPTQMTLNSLKSSSSVSGGGSASGVSVSGDSNNTSRNDEAKSFLIRALGPVTNFFKSRSNHDTSSEKNWLDTANSTSLSESLKQDTSALESVRRGGDDSSSTSYLNRTEKQQSNEYDTSRNDKESLEMKYKLRHIDSGERAWWLNSSEDLTGSSGKVKDEKQKIMNKATPEIVRINLNRIEPIDKNWWSNSSSEKSNGKATNSPIVEKPWFLSSSENDQSNDKQKLNVIKSIEMKQDSDSDESEEDNDDDDAEEEDAEVKKVDDTQSDFHSAPPLGDRASPEGLEDTSTTTGRLSPYDNVPLSIGNSQKNKTKMFISRHTNIDEILGGSPLMDRIMAKEIFEEITPDQVRIHDSSAQMPIIQRAVHDNR